MTTPPPPPGDNPYPSSGSGSTPPNPPTGAPSYGSAPGGGMPPQAPPPAPGGYPQQQGGSDSTKILSLVSMGTGIAGLVLCFCWALPIFPIAALVTGFIAKNKTKTAPRPDLKTFLMVGLITGAIGLAIAILYWILLAAGVINLDAYSDMS
ncbi:DUF4190 domain-containing protein [Janibacter sp. Soil728]|uniref:DUF4190 domain-containing protein n=1 Tax=Janibacter sp. Soil728 TaxID=1736393 RepID=UPI0009EA1E71|nr:DUF4190 domain-containing protein [Janibacter sp. Soil728]